jgi:hypothetical protein
MPGLTPGIFVSASTVIPGRPWAEPDPEGRAEGVKIHNR